MLISVRLRAVIGLGVLFRTLSNLGLWDFQIFIFILFLLRENLGGGQDNDVLVNESVELSVANNRRRRKSMM